MNLSISQMISAEQIAKRITELGKEITHHLDNERLIAICVLRGSFMFYADLVRSIDADIECEFFGVASYHGNTQSSGEVKTTLDLSRPIENTNVLLIEDVVDTGLTMNYLKETLSARRPKKLLTATLLLKPGSLKTACHIDFVGFEIPNDFVVGYGLDYQGYYRNLPFIARVDDFV